MYVAITAATLTLGGVLYALLRLLRGLSAAGRNLPVTADWIEDLSVERYRPMLRLLDSTELDGLGSQPGATPEAAAKLRSQRCRMFRGYLRSLSTDFGRICGAIKLLMVHSENDRPDLAAILIRQQFLFACGLLNAYCRLALFRFGLGGVDVTSLIGIFDGMRIELRNMMPAASAA